MDKPNKTHLMASTRVLRYVKETKNFGVKYEVENKAKLIRYSINDWASCQYSRKSTSKYVFNLGCKVRNKRWLHYYLDMKPSIFPLQVQRVKLFG